MRRVLVAATVMFFLVAGLAHAAGRPTDPPSPARHCDPAGTWYGGSDAQFAYQLTITPVAEPLATGRYNTSAQQALDLPSLGIVSATSFTGTMEKGGRTYQAYMMAMYKLTPETAALVGADPALPEVDAVRGHIELVDCNTLTATWSVYYVYFNFDAVAGDKVPFVTTPDIDVLGGAFEIVETYHRLPSECAICTAGGSLGVAGFPSAVPPRKAGVPRRK